MDPNFLFTNVPVSLIRVLWWTPLTLGLSCSHTHASKPILCIFSISKEYVQIWRKQNTTAGKPKWERYIVNLNDITPLWPSELQRELDHEHEYRSSDIHAIA